MQLPDDAALAAAVEAPVRRPVYRVLVDWADDGRFAHPLSDVSKLIADAGVEVERSLTSGIPAEASLVNGYAAASATVTLSGRYQGEPLASLFSPYYVGGPFEGLKLLGVTALVEMGVETSAGTVFVRQITGPVRAIDVSGTDRTVQLTIADPSDSLRAPITLPFGSLGSFPQLTQQEYPYQIQSQWIVDYVLRRNGYGASLHPNTFCSVTMHGSAVAEIGQATTPAPPVNPTALPDGESFWIDGPHGWLAAGNQWDDPGFVPVVCDFVNPTTTGIGVSAWVWVGPDFHDDDAQWDITFCEFGNDIERDYISLAIRASGEIFTVQGDGGTSVNYGGIQDDNPFTLGWHYVAAHWSRPVQNRCTVTIRWDGLVAAATNIAVNWSGDWRAFSFPNVRFAAPVSDVTWWSDPDAPFFDEDWPGANYRGADIGQIDRGANQLSWVPTRTGVDSWDLLQEVAAAEFGVIGFDEFGLPYFLDRYSLEPDVSTVERTVTSSRELKSLDVGISADTIRNVVDFQTVTAFVVGAVPVFAAVAVDQFETRARTTCTFTVWTEPQTLPWAGELKLPWIDPTVWQDFAKTGVWGFTAIVARSDPPTAIAQNQITVTAEPSGPRRLVIRVVNNSNSTVWLAADGNTPALFAQGYPILFQDPEVGHVEVPDSIARYRERALDLGDSDWYQDPAAVGAMATSLLNELSEPVPVLPTIDVVGDPRVQLGDTLEIQDPERTGGSIRASVVEIKRGVSANDGLADQYGVRPAHID